MIGYCKRPHHQVTMIQLLFCEGQESNVMEQQMFHALLTPNHGQKPQALRGAFNTYSLIAQSQLVTTSNSKLSGGVGKDSARVVTNELWSLGALKQDGSNFDDFVDFATS